MTIFVSGWTFFRLESFPVSKKFFNLYKVICKRIKLQFDVAQVSFNIYFKTFYFSFFLKKLIRCPAENKVRIFMKRGGTLKHFVQKSISERKPWNYEKINVITLLCNHTKQKMYTCQLVWSLLQYEAV